LDVQAFNPGLFAGAAERVADQGITFTDFATERAREPEALRAVYDLFLACSRDIPEIDPVTDVSFAHFVAQEIEDPSALPDGYLLAVDGGHYVGLSNLLASAEEPGVLYQGLTGVLPEYRGRGIATALKLLTVAYARDRGDREIRTWNNTRNRPMLRINEAMGFVKEPVWIVFQKRLRAAGG
jgi:GNAT superfamily N-acetyltransferase